jgi:hypothetical protein
MRSLHILGTAVLVAGAAAMGPSLADAQSQSKAGHKSSVSNILGKQLASPTGAANMLSVGQHLPAGFSNVTQLSALPAPVRALLPQGMNYVMQGNSVAAVDPASRIVRQIIPIPH